MWRRQPASRRRGLVQVIRNLHALVRQASMTAKPHDALFRATFSQLEHPRATLAALLPVTVARHMDWPSLQLVPGSFISDELQEGITDLLYTVRLNT